jgi:hypothetical protein
VKVVFGFLVHKAGRSDRSLQIDRAPLPVQSRGSAKKEKDLRRIHHF